MDQRLLIETEHENSTYIVECDDSWCLDYSTYFIEQHGPRSILLSTGRSNPPTSWQVFDILYRRNVSIDSRLQLY